MDDDHRELVRRLFVAATELIETAHDATVAGQSSEIAAENYAEVARRLHATAQDITVIAEAGMIVANLSINQHGNQSQHSR